MLVATPTPRALFPVVSCTVFALIALAVVPVFQPCRFTPAVALPLTSAPAVFHESQSDLVISIRADDTLYVFNRWYPEHEFVSKARELGASDPHKRIVLNVDQAARFGQVRFVLARLRQAGFRNLLLLTRGHDPLVGVGRLFSTRTS